MALSASGRAIPGEALALVRNRHSHLHSSTHGHGSRRLPTVCYYRSGDPGPTGPLAQGHPSEKGPTTAGFLTRTILAFAEAGISVERVLTDNGGNYRSTVFQKTSSALGIGLRRTRPYRPQTNGKAEAFNKTLQLEWAFRRLYPSNTERLAALAPFVKDYNYARPHTSIGNQPPASRL